FPVGAQSGTHNVSYHRGRTDTAHAAMARIPMPRAAGAAQGVGWSRRAAMRAGFAAVKEDARTAGEVTIMAQPRVSDAVRWTSPGLAVLSYGFRPFFLLGAAFAGFAVPAWLAMLAYGYE